jgi:hypothetical protein
MALALTRLTPIGLQCEASRRSAYLVSRVLVPSETDDYAKADELACYAEAARRFLAYHVAPEVSHALH